MILTEIRFQLYADIVPIAAPLTDSFRFTKPIFGTKTLSSYM